MAATVSEIMDGSLYTRMGHSAQIHWYNHRDTAEEQEKIRLEIFTNK
jgi:hypothetical protein